MVSLDGSMRQDGGCGGLGEGHPGEILNSLCSIEVLYLDHIRNE